MQREVSRKLFQSMCEKSPEWAELTPSRKTEIVNQLERGCFNATIAECEVAGINRFFTNQPFLDRYSAKCMNVAGHLTSEVIVGTRVVARIIAGEIAADKVTYMTQEDLCPEASSKERADIKLRSEQKIIRSVSRMYRCRKCGKNETVHQNFQLARGDEDSTISVKCIHCGNVWRC